MEKNQKLERLEKQIRFIVEIDKVKNKSALRTLSRYCIFTGAAFVPCAAAHLSTSGLPVKSYPQERPSWSSGRFTKRAPEYSKIVLFPLLSRKSFPQI